MAEARKVALVVEDETLIRLMAADILHEAGFEVIEAGDAQEALQTLEQDAQGIHLLFTDVDMPGDMTGLMLAHHARQHWPWIGLLVASGKSTLTAEELPSGGRFLSKPYSAVTVATQAHELASTA